MKQNELRVGNYVIDKEDDQVYQIPSGLSINGSDLVRPIELTEAWLLTLGFKYCEFTVADDDGVLRERKAPNKDYFYHPNLSDKISIYLPYFDINYYIGNVSCKYVHQLQNFYYALTQKELTK